MKVIGRDEFKAISISLLDKFAYVCNKNNLLYCLDYGTLLGAIRHKGFIPWDDDIDVVMPRKDYDNLCAIASHDEYLFGEHVHLALPCGEYTVQKPYANLIDSRTITTSTFRQEKYYYPIWIDIFPMDYASEDTDKFLQTVNKVDKMKRNALRPTRKLEGKDRFLLAANAFIFSPFIDKRMKKIDQYVRNQPESAFLTNYMGPYKTRDIVSKTYFDSLCYCAFEGKQYLISDDYDSRLQSLYGDYHKLPPEEERIAHTVKAYYIS